jgi:hypothetical protein
LKQHEAAQDLTRDAALYDRLDRDGPAGAHGQAVAGAEGPGDQWPGRGGSVAVETKEISDFDLARRVAFKLAKGAKNERTAQPAQVAVEAADATAAFVSRPSRHPPRPSR